MRPIEKFQRSIRHIMIINRANNVTQSKFKSILQQLVQEVSCEPEESKRDTGDQGKGNK